MKPYSKQLQAKHIPDIAVLRVLARAGVTGDCGEGPWHTYETNPSMPAIQDAFPPACPRSLMRAKMAALIKKGLVGGCTCGCRGDFHLLSAGWSLVSSLDASQSRSDPRSRP